MTLVARRPHVAVAVFPGTWSERDFAHVARTVLGWTPEHSFEALVHQMVDADLEALAGA